ncbi:MAG: TIM barrel protein [Propionivibrio sp.]
MELSLGIKSDPVLYRYSFESLFAFMQENGVNKLQLGSFFELYSVDEDFFVRLRAQAESYGIHIKSCFTAHRELGGFFTGDRSLEKVARASYERLIRVAAVLGADFVGSNPGAVLRDRMQTKPQGIACYIAHMHELMVYARDQGLRALTVEPMSSLAEPPATPDEISDMMQTFADWHAAHPDSTVPVYLCGDTSHGVADRDRRVVHSNVDLFVHQIPWMAEFHFKNTDAIFNSTFGFSADDCRRGIVDLAQIKALIDANQAAFPVPDLTGYLELGGPKLGRDYADPLLYSQLKSSLDALKSHFG